MVAGKRTSSGWLQPSLGRKQAMAVEARGELKKHVLVLISLAGASGKTELYPVVGYRKKLFSACRLLLRATWGWFIYALPLTQT